MTGHASADQLRDIASREQSLDPQTTPVGELVELALLYVEPAHREDDAIALLEAAVGRGDATAEQREEAAIWLAYVLLHHGMDAPSLERATAVLQPLAATSAAANMLLAEIGEEQGADVSQRIRLLEASVAQRGDWIDNRHDLAVAYAEAGRRSDAVEQLEAALALAAFDGSTLTPAERAFEESITGRLADGVEARLREAMRDLS